MLAPRCRHCSAFPMQLPATPRLDSRSEGLSPESDRELSASVARTNPQK